MERFALGILATGCSVVVPGPGDLTPTQGSDAGTDAQTHDMDAGRDAGADAGHDGGADSGHHGGRDAGFDAAADATVDLDAGSCGMCEGTTPFCDSTGACVECLENSHCDDGLHCTVDRCSFGTCTSTPQNFCVAEVVAGNARTCARYATGAVYCWGSNSSGALGDGTTDNRNVPVQTRDITDAAELALGAFHSCARRSNGRVMCWGANNHGQLGDGTMTDRLTPVSVTDLVDAVELAASGSTVSSTQ